MLDVYYMDVCPLQQEELFSRQLQLVQPRRRERILQSKQKGDRCRMLAAGLLLREGLMRQGVDYDLAVFREGEHGKPELAEPGEGGSLHFNLSHGGNLAAAAFCAQPVGIDVESVKRFSEGKFSKDKSTRIMGLASRIMTAEELAWFQNLEESKQGAELIRIWTRRESYAKAVGKGIPVILAKEDPGKTAYYESFRLGDYWLTICTLHAKERVALHRVDGREIK